MQPSAPLTTDWSTSATVPEQTSACERGTGHQAGARVTGPTPSLPPHLPVPIPCRPAAQKAGRLAHTGPSSRSSPHTHDTHGVGQSGAQLTPPSWGNLGHGPQRTPDAHVHPDSKACPQSFPGAHGKSSTSCKRPGICARRRAGDPQARAKEGNTPQGRPGPLGLALRPLLFLLGTRSKRRPRTGPWGCPPPSPAPSPGGRRHRRQTSWEPPRRLVGGPSCRGARQPGRTGSPASCVGPPSGRTWTRPRAAPPAPARFAA